MIWKFEYKIIKKNNSPFLIKSDVPDPDPDFFFQIRIRQEPDIFFNLKSGRIWISHKNGIIRPDPDPDVKF